MTYYDSAEGVMLNARQTIKLLENHGIMQVDIEDCLDTVKTTNNLRDTQHILDWLGY